MDSNRHQQKQTSKYPPLVSPSGLSGQKKQVDDKSGGDHDGKFAWNPSKVPPTVPGINITDRWRDMMKSLNQLQPLVNSRDVNEAAKQPICQELGRLYVAMNEAKKYSDDSLTTYKLYPSKYSELMEKYKQSKKDLAEAEAERSSASTETKSACATKKKGAFLGRRTGCTAAASRGGASGPSNSLGSFRGAVDQVDKTAPRKRSRQEDGQVDADDEDSPEGVVVGLKKNAVTKHRVNGNPDKMGIGCPFCNKAAAFTESTLKGIELGIADIEWDDKDQPKWVSLSWDAVPEKFRRISAWKSIRKHLKEKHADKITDEQSFPALLRRHTTKLKAEKKQAKAAKKSKK